MKSNKLDYVQTAKVVNPKMLLAKESNLVHGEKFSSNGNFLVTSPCKLNQDQLAVFSTVLASLVLFPLCLFWTYFFS